MLAVLYAGFLLAWAIIYLFAATYGLSTLRRDASATPGTPSRNIPGVLLAGFFGTLTVASTATALSIVVEPVSLSATLARVGHAAVMPAPVLLIHFVHLERRAPLSMHTLGAGYGLAAVFAIISTTGALDVEQTAAHFGAASALGKVAVVTLTVSILIAAYQIGRGLKTLGVPSFAGACVLFVSAVYDCVTTLANLPRPAFVLPGFAAYTMAFFVGQIARQSRRGQDLAAKTVELSRKSKSLTRSFRELRARQDELVRKEQLAAIGELSAVIAHEVRNPLAIMSNAVATLRRTNADDESKETLLTILTEEGARLNQLVGDLLHYAKPLALERQSVSLVDLVKKACAPTDSRLDVLVRLSSTTDVPNVGGDALLLRQVLDNLVNNALQAMSSGGTLTVELRASISAGGQSTRGAELVIRDTGEGMDTVVRKRALDPFFTTRPSGTGLGLAIVARVIDAHGGSLTIRSERGAGTEVRVFLPADDEIVARARHGQRLLQPIIEPFEHPDREGTDRRPDHRAERKREAS